MITLLARQDRMLTLIFHNPARARIVLAEARYGGSDASALCALRSIACSERGRSEGADARCEHEAIDAHGQGLGVWLQVGRVARSRGRPGGGSW